MSLLCLLIMAIILISCESLMSKTTSSSRSITHTHINRWSNQISNSRSSSSSSSSRLLAAAPDAPKGRGPPPRKAPKDDVVQVIFVYLYVCMFIDTCFSVFRFIFINICILIFVCE
jgi:hypothetical protein